ncbi:membrane protein insertion efficiency factor YidD [Caldithrix abyssi]|nr:membrane protein insertion efficiency factor YidD [Caldithrix abyssi]
MNSIFISAIKLYRITLSPFLGNNCRFYPTCSQYGIDAFQSFPFFKAFGLTVKRIVKCHPFSKGGIDTIPR